MAYGGTQSSAVGTFASTRTMSTLGFILVQVDVDTTAQTFLALSLALTLFTGSKWHFYFHCKRHA
jgi:hypothetical protein